MYILCKLVENVIEYNGKYYKLSVVLTFYDFVIRTFCLSIIEKSYNEQNIKLNILWNECNYDTVLKNGLE